LKKNREAEGKYLIEGDKIVVEAISENADLLQIYATKDWIEEGSTQLSDGQKDALIEVDQKTLQKIGQLSTANRVVALVKKTDKIEAFSLTSGDWIVALDRVQDPGNMGTIIRTADWFGIKNILCAKGSVEVYNPKVIQSAMGSLFRMNIHSVDLLETVRSANGKSIPIYGAALSGENLLEMKNDQPGILLLGNESKGLSEELLDLLSKQVKIPGKGKAESLNVAIAAGIIMAWATK